MSTPGAETTAASYLLGHSGQELLRLEVQARLLEPITRRFLLDARILPGMRVLDVGCGLGDVTFLCAELVGSAGQVVGVDRAAAAIAAARQRARSKSVANVTFLEGDATDMHLEPSFDAVVGRYVLMYQLDPVAALRALARNLRTGGVIVFHELDWGGARSVPPAPTFDRCCRWVAEALQRGGAEAYMGTKLYASFVEAGLAAPTMRLEAVIGGPADASGSVRDLNATIFPTSLVPTLERFGIATAAEIDPETLPERMQREISRNGSVIVGRSEVAAWSRIP